MVMLRSMRIAALALCARLAVAVPPLEAHGADFVNPTTGNRFQIVGIDYQPGGSSGYNPGSDPLTDSASCLRDAALMQRLGINCIRVYNLDPAGNHDLCASIFNAVGIYMILDVNSPLPNESLDRGAPWNSYNPVYLNRTFGVVEAFKNYPNTLMFFSGNEVINDIPSGGIVTPYIRAVTRDLKNYISKHSKRQIPVGYSAADVRPILLDTWNYLRCTTTGDSKDISIVDAFALNSYSWCGGDNYQTSGYDVLTSYFSQTTVPVFFSEYGCNRVSPRVFEEVQALYGPLMVPSLSGGLVYEYNQAENNYGLVLVNSDGSAKVLADFDNLQSQYNKLNYTLLEGLRSTNGSVTPPACNASLITNAGFSNNFTIPSLPPGSQVVIDNGLSNPNSGKLVSITSTQVTQKVQNSNGAVISGLAIKPLPDDQSNSASGVNDTSTPTTTSAAPAATTSKSGAKRLTSLSSALLLFGTSAMFWLL